jgi:hypothetical protein
MPCPFSCHIPQASNSNPPPKPCTLVDLCQLCSFNMTCSLFQGVARNHLTSLRLVPKKIAQPQLLRAVRARLVSQIGFQDYSRYERIINAVQFVLYLFFGSETRYIGHRPMGVSQTQIEHLHFRRIDPTPFTLFEFYQPLLLVRCLRITIPVASYAMVFGSCSVMSTVEIPALLGPKFGFNSQEIGLQFLGVITGTLVGELLGRNISDFVVKEYVFGIKLSFGRDQPWYVVPVPVMYSALHLRTSPILVNAFEVRI